jgi:hypothetical protein
MSKKLIAVASASALALSALVGIAPATALPFASGSTGNSIAVTVASPALALTGTGTNSDPYKGNVPSDGTVLAASLVKFSVSSDIKSRAITVATTSGIKLLDAPGDATNKYTAASGLASWTSTTDAAGAAVFYAFPTTTTKGVITVTLDGDITQIYLTGNAGPAYDITSATLPSLEVSAAGVIIATVTDAFGNAVTAGSLTVSRVGTGTTSGADYVEYSTTTTRWQGSITAGAVAGSLAVGLTITGLTATADQKTAFGDPANTYFGIINVAAAADAAALRAQIATLTAQLAALQIIKDRKVSKLKYNRLARKWNAAFPNNKVWVKP